MCKYDIIERKDRWREEGSEGGKKEAREGGRKGKKEERKKRRKRKRVIKGKERKTRYLGYTPTRTFRLVYLRLELSNFEYLRNFSGEP